MAGSFRAGIITLCSCRRKEDPPITGLTQNTQEDISHESIGPTPAGNRTRRIPVNGCRAHSKPRNFKIQWDS